LAAARIVIADDHGLLRAALRALLAAEPEFEVVGEAASGEEAVRIAIECRPDIVILDISMPGAGGLAATRTLHEKLPGTRVLILTVHEDGTLVREAIRAGASGYIVKRAVEGELISAMRAVRRGELYLHPTMTRALLQIRSDDGAVESAEPVALTHQEAQVLLLLARGLTNRQIAGELGLSVRLAEARRAEIMSKLGLKSRVELVRWAIARRLIE
jgi:DNA-binding NarL/FixJ family response regulator